MLCQPNLLKILCQPHLLKKCYVNQSEIDINSIIMKNLISRYIIC